MFLAPWFLLGLTAAAIPLVLHLRRARQVRRISFSTTRFFDEAFMRAARRARLQDILLMLLRVALFCLFALALAQPLLRLPGLAGLGVGRRHVAIVLDDSASMGVVTERGTLLDRARAAALTVLDELSPTAGDRATVILAGRRDGGPVVLFDEPSDDIEAVKRAVRDVALTDLGTDLDSAVRTAGKVLAADPEDSGSTGAGQGAALEVYVFSDLQAGAFAAEVGPQSGGGVGLLLVSVSPGAAAEQNVSVDAVQYGSPRPVLGVPFTVRGLITNHGDQPSRRRLSLVVDDEVVGQQEVDLEPGRSTAVRFVHRFNKVGWRRGRIELEPVGDSPGGGSDPLPVDDRRYFAVRVEETVHVLAVNGAPSQIAANDELFFFRLALTAVPERSTAESSARRVQIEQVDATDLSAARLQRFPVVVLANVATLTPQQLEMIEHYVDGGGNLLIALGDRVDPRAYNKWTGPNRLHGGLLPGPLRALARPRGAEAEVDPDTPSEAAFIAAVDSAHPALAGFADAQLGYLTAVRLEAWYGFDAPPTSVLMRTSTGQPLLAEKGFGRGRVLLFASTLDRDWTDFPLQPTFVPWAYRLVSYLAQPSLDRSGFVRTGQVVTLPVSITAGQSLVVSRPDGGAVYPEQAVGGANPPLPRGASAVGGVNAVGGAVVLGATERAGIYAVRRSAAKEGDPPRLLLAANVPSRESELRYLDEAGCRAVLGSDASWVYVADPEAVTDAAAVARHGYGLWDYLLMLALLVGLFEPWVANRLAKRRGGPAADALDRRSTVAAPRPDADTEAA